MVEGRALELDMCMPRCQDPTGLAERPGTFRGITEAKAPGRKSSVMVLSPLGVPCWELPVGSGFANSTARHLPGYKTEAKAIGLRGTWPCATSPHPETDRLEAKQLRTCLLKTGNGLWRKKTKATSQIARFRKLHSTTKPKAQTPYPPRPPLPRV